MTTNSIEIIRIVRDYYEQFHANKLDNLNKQIPVNTKPAKTKSQRKKWKTRRDLFIVTRVNE